MDLSILSIYNPWWDLSKNTGEIKDKLVNYSALTDRASGRELSPHPEDPQEDSCFSKG